MVCAGCASQNDIKYRRKIIKPVLLLKHNMLRLAVLLIVGSYIACLTIPGTSYRTVGVPISTGMLYSARVPGSTTDAQQVVSMAADRKALAVSSMPIHLGLPPFSVVPFPSLSVSGRLGYFNFNLKPGDYQRGYLQIANTSDHVDTLVVTRANGETATDSGDAYVAVMDGRSCEASACWLTGLPKTITLLAGKSEVIQFGVKVPKSASAGQQLAGVATQLINQPSTTSSSSIPGVSAKVNVVTQVTIGVATTIGNPARLHPNIQIVSVTSGVVGSTQSVVVREANRGNTFVHPKGSLVIRYNSREISHPVVSSTVLPGWSATLSIPLPHVVPPGAWPVSVSLCYASGKYCRKWSGDLSFSTSTGNTLHVVRNQADAISVAHLTHPHDSVLLITLAILVMFFGLVISAIVVVRNWRSTPK